MSEIIFREESYKIIGACMEVHRKLGPGFLESVYSEALEIEFKHAGIPYGKEKKLPVYYDDQPLHKYFRADYMCYESIIIEPIARNHWPGLRWPSLTESCPVKSTTAKILLPLNMRLDKFEIESIKDLARLHFGKDVQVILFGSRTSNNKRGGDIDLFIRKQSGDKPDVRSKLNFITDLIFRIGEQKIDVVLDNPAMHKSEFLKTIYSTGIQLC
jgi:GxxExxY protein